MAYRGVRGGVVDRWVKKDGTPSRLHGTPSRYAARYVDGESREHQRVFVLKREAEVWLRQQLAAVDAGDHVDPRSGRISVSDFHTAYVAGTDGHQAKKTRSRRASWMTKYVLPRWGSVPVRAITPASVRSWVTELVDRDLEPGTVRGIVGVLSRIMDVAVEQKVIKANPVHSVVMPKDRPKPRRPYLTHAQVLTLATAAGSMLSRESDRVAVLLMAYTGVRIGELSALSVGDVNHAARRLWVMATKDGKARSVPFPEPLAAPLARLCADRALDAPLCPSERGKRIWTAWRADVFKPAVAKCVADDATFPTVTPHDLRHTAASLAVASGASVLAVQRMLGHARAAMTLDTYADLFDTDLDAVAERMGTAITSAAESLRKPRRATA